MVKIKVVYNASFGGFGLSNAALQLGRELSGIADWGVVNEDGEYVFMRHDPILVSVVETLGAKANGRYSNLQIKTLRGTKYRIDEYDGSETVMEPKDYDWIDAK